MKKITYLVLHLGYGGVEKAVANQANILCDFCQVEIISAYRLYSEPPFRIDPRVTIRYLMQEGPNRDALSAAINAKNPISIIKEGLHACRLLRGRTALMKKAIRQSDADLLLSTRYLYDGLLARNKPAGTITAAEEHRHHNGDEAYIRKLLKAVSGLDYLLPVSKELTGFYQQRLQNSSVQCVYIPHNIDDWPETPAPLEGQRLVSVGRLSPEKGFVDLIDAFAYIARACPEATLHIIGDGAERAAVEEKLRALSLEDKVILHGYREKPFVNEALASSAVFVLASYEESFGIVLLEAQSHGLPCVAYSSAQGAHEIISEGENGYLIPDRNPQAFAEAVIRLLDDRELRLHFGCSARKNGSRYTQEAVAAQWKQWLDRILASS